MDEGVFDLGTAAAVAAHDQQQAKAMALLRDSCHFVLATVDHSGRFVMLESAPMSLLSRAERLLRRERYRIAMESLNRDVQDIDWTRVQPFDWEKDEL